MNRPIRGELQHHVVVWKRGRAHSDRIHHPDRIHRALVTMGVVALTVAALAALVNLASPRSGRVLPPPNGASSVAAGPAAVVAPRPAPFIQKSAGDSVVNLSEATPGASLHAPTDLQIPAIGLRTTVVPLGRNADGSVVVPSATTFTGWYDLGPKPGEIGPAVIIGHVDSYKGPGVFFDLKSLLPGDVVTVDDGDVPVSFRVQRIVTYAKNEFPTVEVFGPTPDAELRLITCGGPFDRAIGHYEDNIVVYAVAT